MKYMDVKTAAAGWGLTERRVTALCRDGRIEGAKKTGGIWLIPDDVPKPEDGRKNRTAALLRKETYLQEVKQQTLVLRDDAPYDKYDKDVKEQGFQIKDRQVQGHQIQYHQIPDHQTQNPQTSDHQIPDSRQQNQQRQSLPLPIGVSDFRELITGYYYVDKTLMIKEFLDARPKVSLFTRPRRFGKTLAMDMLKTYFEISDSDTAQYFKGLAIWGCGERYRREQGRYPVISLSFKDIKFPSWEQTFEALRDVIAQEYRRHAQLLESSACSKYDKSYYESVLYGTVSEVGLTGALRNLSVMLREYWGRPVVIIIDEYDTPVQQGYTAGFYVEIIGFLRNLLSGAFKDNGSLAFGFMTGILRVAKESIFSGLNNITTHSIFDNKYSEYFGFTGDEVRRMAAHYACSEKFEELCEWYDGYRFGNREVFNPWSVLNYFYYACRPQAYWQSTGDNSIIRQIVSEADAETADNLRMLMQGEAVTSYVDSSVIYPEIKSNPETIYSFLLSAGYLKVQRKEDLYSGDSICVLRIPNKEILCVYEKEILSALSDAVLQSSAIAVQQAILTQNIPKLEKELQSFLLRTISYFDYAQETFFHGLLLGLCAVMNHLYSVDSNRESGLGRYDIQLCPYDLKMPGILIELKVLEGEIREEQVNERLAVSAADALDQIGRKQYETDLKKRGVQTFLKIGIAFYKKQVKLVSKRDRA